MTSNRTESRTEKRATTPESVDTTKAARWPLIAWPMALVALTLLLFFGANAVPAWGSRDGDRLERFERHAERFIDRTLDRIDASDDQKARVQEIARATIEDLAALHADRQALHSQLAALMTAETIDRDAIEALRASQLSRADELSRIVSGGLADVLDVLSVEQRSALEERLRRHHGHHRHHGRLGHDDGHPETR